MFYSLFGWKTEQTTEQQSSKVDNTEPDLSQSDSLNDEVTIIPENEYDSLIKENQKLKQDLELAHSRINGMIELVNNTEQSISKKISHMSEQIEDLTNYKTEKENYIKQLEKSKVEQEILQEEELKKLERKVNKQVKIIDELVIRLKEKKNVHTL